MGGTKKAWMEHQENQAAATSYLVQIGQLKRCDAHEEIVYGGGFWTLEGDFYRNCMADRNRGDRGPIPWAAKLEAREFTDLLKSAYEDHPGSSCGRCDKNAAE